MASELSALRAELWRTRDDLERMKSRTPPSTQGSPCRAFDRRYRDSSGGGDSGGGDGGARDGVGGGVSVDRKSWQERATIKGARKDRGGAGGDKDGGLRSGRTSPPTSGESSTAAAAAAEEAGACDGGRGSRRRDTNSPGGNVRGKISGVRLGSEEGEEEEEVAAEETICNLELEGVAFKNWTEEASSIAVRLIEEVKTLRWERATWADREGAAESAAAELRVRAEALEARLDAAEAEAKRSREALLRLQEVEREQAQAAERAKSELRAARESERELRAQVDGTGGGGFADGGERGGGGGRGGGGQGGVRGGLREELRREREGADALQRRLDAARAAAARHERERKEWGASAARLETLRRGLKTAKAEAVGHERERRELRASALRLEELRQSWGKQLKKVERKMRHMAKENAALQVRAEEAERTRDRYGDDASRHRDELQRLAEQRDNLLLGATRAGHLSASSPADALAELLAAAAAGVVAGTAGGSGSEGGSGAERGVAISGRGGREGVGARGGDGGGFREAGGKGELEAALGRARSEAKAARVAAQQERLRREGEARDKEEAVRQLHRLMGAARRALGRRESRLRSSRLETEVVWNALTEAVR